MTGSGGKATTMPKVQPKIEARGYDLDKKKAHVRVTFFSGTDLDGSPQESVNVDVAIRFLGRYDRPTEDQLRQAVEAAGQGLLAHLEGGE